MRRKNGANNGLTTSPVGGNFLALDGAFLNLPLMQTINGLIPGKFYTVPFYYAAARQSGFNGWKYETLSFQATSSSEALSFLAEGTPNGVPPFALLDGVSLNLAPEPGTWTLFAFGILGAFAKLAYSRRKIKTEPRP
jgi:hypothetical protein